MINSARRFFNRRLVGIIAAALFVGSFLLYVSTMAPSVAPGDSAEFQFVPYILGIAHPPGYALYVLLGKLFTLLPLGSVAYRMNLFSAFCGALTVSLTYLIILQLSSGKKSSLAAQVPAILGAATFAVSANLWQHSTFTNA
ncbi:MAG: protein O-mannosyl-transferase family, partial [Anaerolineae bacterium]